MVVGGTKQKNVLRMENNINNGQNTVITSRPYLQSDGAIHVQLPSQAEPDRNGQVAVPKGDGNVQTLNFYLSPPTSSASKTDDLASKSRVTEGQASADYKETSVNSQSPIVTTETSPNAQLQRPNQSSSPTSSASNPVQTIKHRYHPPLRSQPSVPRFPGGSSNSNRDIDRLKNQHHEELRRRASYQKIYKEVQNSNDGIPTDAPAGFKEPHPRTPHNYHLEKIKREPRPQPKSTDSDESSDAEDVMTDIVPIPTAPEMPVGAPLLPVVSQPILAVPVHHLPSQMTSYQANSMIPLPDYNNYTKLEPHPALGNQSINFDPNDDLSSTVLSGNGPEGMVIEATKRREVRLQKNREAARECRRKKKEYIKCLENRVQVLEAQNKGLIDELKNLKEMYCHKPAGGQQQ